MRLMPPDLKLRGLKRKYILKRAAEKLLPREVVWRKKAGFGAPIRSWLRGPLRPMATLGLSDAGRAKESLTRAFVAGKANHAATARRDHDGYRLVRKSYGNFISPRD